MNETTQGINVVEVDEAALAAEVAALEAAAPPPVEAAPEPAAPAESWGPMVEGITPQLALFVFPQWNLTPAERAEFTQSLTLCLDQLLPGGLAGKYACYVRLILLVGGVAASRYIMHGKLPPLGPKIEKEKPAEQPAQA